MATAVSFQPVELDPAILAPTIDQRDVSVIDSRVQVRRDRIMRMLRREEQSEAANETYRRCCIGRDAAALRANAR